MSNAQDKTGEHDLSRSLPRGRAALPPEKVIEVQRRRLITVVPGLSAERGYEAATVADLVRRAGISRNTFYEIFANKQECFAAANEACHEQLLAVLTQSCDERASAEKRVEMALGAMLTMFAAQPGVPRLLFVEAPSAGREIALRYHQWLRRYAVLLRSAISSGAARPSSAVEMEQAIVGGIASRIANEVLQGRTARMYALAPHLVAYVLAFYDLGTGLSEPGRRP